MHDMRRVFSPFRALVGLSVLTGSLTMATGLSAQDQDAQDVAPTTSPTQGAAQGQDAQDVASTPSPTQDAASGRGASGTQGATSNLVLSAVVDSSGKLISGNGVVSARRMTPTGRYEVIFETDVANGTYVATIGGTGTQPEPSGEVSVTRRLGNPRGVLVQTANSSGTAADRGFHLTVSLGSPIDGPTPPPPVTIRTVSVRVHRHSSVALTDADAKRILREMSEILQKPDPSGDVPTPVEFVLDGSVQPLPAGIPGSIQTAQQLDAVFAVGPGVKIVRDIQFCGSPGGSIIGCAPVGSPIVDIAAVRFPLPIPGTQDQEGILWAHEYGHNAGLDHRNGPNAVMFPSIAPTHRVVNLPESNRFRGGPLAATGRFQAATQQRNPGAGNAPATARVFPGSQGENQDLPRPDNVLDFVRKYYVEGVPIRLASTYNRPEDVEELLKMLANPKENEQYLPQIVTTLCYVGSEKAIDPLIKFVQSPLASEVAFKAKKAALLHLGDLVNRIERPAAAAGVQPATTEGQATRAESQTALNFLASVARTQERPRALAAPRVAAAANAAVNQEAVTPPSPDELAAEMALAATLGLATSGTQKAEAAINSLRAAESPAYESVKDAAVQALETVKEVRSLKGGAREYREKRSEHRDHK